MRPLRVLVIASAAASIACGARTDVDVGRLATGDASASAPDAGVDASGDGPSLPDALAPLDLTCPKAPGVQPRAAWPMPRRCPDRSASTPAVGPRVAPRVAWRFPTPPTESLVIAADGTLYVPGAGGSVVALAPDGKVRWTARPASARSAVVSLAIRADGTLYVFDGVAVHAVLPTGAIAWSTPVASCGGSFGIDVGEGGAVYGVDPGCAGGPASLVAIAPDGTLAWRAPLDALDASPASVGGDGEMYLLAFRTDDAPALFAFDASARLAWSADPPGNPAFDPYANGLAPPLVGGDGTIVYSLTGKVPQAGGIQAVGPDGSPRWWYPFPVPPTGAPLAITADGTVYASDTSGVLHAIRHDGSEAWHWGGAPGSRTSSHVVVGGDGTVYVSLQAPGPGGTAALDASGRLLWLASDVGLPLAIGADGTLYTMGSALSALRP